MPEIKKDIQASSTAERIANDINSTFKITWVSPLLVQIFIVLTKYIRDVLYNYLISQKASLQIWKAQKVRDTQKWDVLAEQVAKLRSLTAVVTSEIDSFLKIIPIDSTLKFIPEVDEFLETLSSNVPIKIPESTIFNIAEIGGFELLDGVTDYKSLKEKVDELEFRLTRATSLSHYAQAGSSYIDSYLKKIDVYLEIIVTLNTERL